MREGVIAVGAAVHHPPLCQRCYLQHPGMRVELMVTPGEEGERKLFFNHLLLLHMRVHTMEA